MQQYFIYSGLIIGPIFIVMGLFLFLRPPSEVSGTGTEYFGLLGVGYGGFRLWRSWVAFRQQRRQTDEQRYSRRNTDGSSSHAEHDASTTDGDDDASE